jgi:hypothetical protein
MMEGPPHSSFEGNYTRRQGLRRRYEYAANWHHHGPHVVWSATVWVIGEGNKGYLDGLFQSVDATDHDLKVKARIEQAIEKLEYIIE